MSSNKVNEKGNFGGVKNNTSFAKQAIEQMRNAHARGVSVHQARLKDFLKKNPRCRGLLVYHSLGSGKTKTAVSIAESFLDEYDVKIITSKSLHSNMKDEIINYALKTLGISDPEQHVDEHYKFITLNASNLIKKIEELDDVLEEKLGAVMSSGSLENTMVIIDEAHRFFNSIIRGSKNATKLYDLIMSTRNIKLLFLTGTPLTNDSFELVPCINMLAGFPILGESYEDFQKYFMKEEFKEKLMDRLTGMISYYQPVDLSAFPKQLETKIIHVPMSEKQFAIYYGARRQEKDSAIQITNKRPQRLMVPAVGSSFRMKSRQVSNCILDNEERTPEWFEIHSPKALECIKIVNNHPNQLGIFYSQFIEYGVDIISSILTLNGFNYVDNISKVGPDSFSIISGDIDIDVRDQIVKIFTSPANMHGELIRILIITSTGAEGLNLKAIRYIVAFEPFFNLARIDQVIGRGVRYGSHLMLPEDERDVQPYVLISVAPAEMDSNINEDIKEKDLKELTTDQVLWDKSLEKMTKINYMLDILKNASIDCYFNHCKDEDCTNCHICHPSGQPLYIRDMLKDMEIPSPCKKMTESKITAEELIVKTEDGKEYKVGYVFDNNEKDLFNLHIFLYNPRLDSYQEIFASHQLYDIISSEIMRING